jgi:hypothetical protein
LECIAVPTPFWFRTGSESSFGGKPKLTDHQQAEALKRLAAG